MLLGVERNPVLTQTLAALDQSPGAVSEVEAANLTETPPSSFSSKPPCQVSPAAKKPHPLISVAAFLYAFSMHKFAVRNGLSSDTGIQGIVELVGMVGAFVCVLVATRREKRKHAFSAPYTCFAVLGFFALCSFWRSFYPALSAVKGVIFLSVITTGYLVNQAGLGRQYFRALYRWYIVSLVVGLITGILLPSMYPLFSVDEYSGRTTMQVFDTFFLVIGEDAALFLLLAPIIRGNIGVLSQVFLFVVNIFAGGKVSTALLCTLLTLRFFTGVRRWRSWHTVGVIVAVAFTVTIATYAFLHSGLDTRLVTQSTEAIYGTKVGVEAKGLDGRLGLWLGALPLLQNVWFLGYGFEGFRDLLLKIAIWSGSSHNGYLEMALASGMIGFTAFLTGLATTLWACLRVGGRMSFYLLSLALFIMIDAMAGGSLHNPSFVGFLILLWLPYNRNDGAIAAS